MSDYEFSSSDSESDEDSITSFAGGINNNTSTGKQKGVTIEQYEDNESEDDNNDDDDDDELNDDDEKVGGANSDLEEGEIDENELSDNEMEEQEEEEEDENEYNETPKKEKSAKTKPAKKPIQIPIDSDEEDDDESDDNYLQKFDSELTKNYITDYHPECFVHNYEEIANLSKVVRNADNIIIDPLHKTIPFLTKYEKARVLGQRAKQIESGSKPFVRVPENVIDGYIIAELELKQKRIPFIIRRPLPNGGCEYWNLKDLEMINF